jgi:hypothetical protein
MSGTRAHAVEAKVAESQRQIAELTALTADLQRAAAGQR